MGPYCNECCTNIQCETVCWILHRALIPNLQTLSIRDEGSIQTELMTGERARNKFIAENWDKDNDSGVTVDVKWKMSQ